MAVLTERPNFEAVPVSGPVGSIIDGRYAPPPVDGGGQQWVRTSMLIQRKPGRALRSVAGFDKAPQWMEQVSSVTVTGPKTTHWVMQVGDTPVEWDAEVLEDEPGKRIAWRSTGGAMDQAGEVMFTARAGGPRNDRDGAAGVSDDQAGECGGRCEGA